MSPNKIHKPKMPKTATGFVKAIEKALESIHSHVVQIRQCRAGWGVCFYQYHPHETSHYIVFSYYPTIDLALKAEYRRIVLKDENEKGGTYEEFLLIDKNPIKTRALNLRMPV